MIRVVFFDLGLTLIDDRQRPFPHVADALATIQSFQAGKKPLVTALVSDFTMPAPPPTAAKIKALFAEYLAILDATGLRPFFEPVERRVTLSTHAGAAKPARAIFATALLRLQVKVPLKECLLVTENAAHVKAVRRDLGMGALLFHSAATGPFDFDDWLQAPALIAHLVGGTAGPNAAAALRDHLRAAHGFDLAATSGPKGGPTKTVRGTLWRPVGGEGDTAGLHAPFEVEGRVTYGRGGRIRSVHLDAPAPAAVREAGALVRSLAAHGQLATAGNAPRTGPTTHEIQTDAQGRRKLVRRRFRAF